MLSPGRPRGLALPRAQTKNGVGRLLMRGGGRRRREGKEPQALVTSIGMPGPMVVVMVALRM